jgi:chemotaxis protein MotB
MSLKPVAAALAAAALLSACVSPVPFNQRVQKSSIYQQVDAQLQPRPAADAAQLEQLQNLVRLTLPNGALFAEGSSSLSDAGKAFLDKLAPALKGLAGQRVVVKGFTDDMAGGAPLIDRFASNVALSKARAGAVAAYLQAQGVPAVMVTFTGLGQSHPVASNDSAEGRSENRRTEIDVVEAPA